MVKRRKKNKVEHKNALFSACKLIINDTGDALGQFLPDPSPSLMSLVNAQELNPPSFPFLSDHYTPSPPLNKLFALSERY